MNRKPVAGAGFDQIAEFGFWSLFGGTIGDWYGLTVGQVYPLCFCLLVGVFVQDVECDRGTTVSHQIYHLSRRNKGKSEESSLSLNYASYLGVTIHLIKCKL